MRFTLPQGQLGPHDLHKATVMECTTSLGHATHITSAAHGVSAYLASPHCSLTNLWSWIASDKGRCEGRKKDRNRARTSTPIKTRLPARLIVRDGLGSVGRNLFARYPLSRAVFFVVWPRRSTGCAVVDTVFRCHLSRSAHDFPPLDRSPRPDSAAGRVPGTS